MPVPTVRQTPATKTARVYRSSGVIGRAGASHVRSRPTKSLVGAAASAAAQHDHEDNGDGDRDSGADQEKPGLAAPAGLVSLFMEGCHDLTSSLSLPFYGRAGNADRCRRYELFAVREGSACPEGRIT